MRAAIYTRISDDRTHKGLGVTRQQTDCQHLADRNGWHVTTTHTDNDTSAYTGRPRPAYNALCDQVRDGAIDVIIAWHPDRLHRSPRELEDFIDLLESTGATVATVTAGDWDLATPEGRAMARIVGAIARKESEDKSRRSRRKHAELAAAGKPAGGGTRAFGFEADMVTHRPGEARLIREAATAVLAGRSVRGICADWNTAGVVTVTGREWRPAALRRLLRSGRVAGWRDHSSGRVRAVWDPIIDPAVHERVVAVLSDPGRRVNGNPTRYLLSGIAVCGRCGTRLIARPRPGGRRAMVCSSDPWPGGCGRIRVMADPLETFVTAAVIHVVGDVDRPDHDPTDGLLTELADIADRLAQVARDHYVDRAIGPVQFRAATAALEAQERDLRAQVARAQQRAAATLVAADGLEAAWPTLGFDQRRTIIAGVVERVTVGPAVRGRNFFDPSRVTITWSA